MAFNMNRPIIKGTANHKASVAKATQKSIVSQARTTADAGLIAASNALGKSYVPEAIDFELDKINIDVPEKKELTEAEKAARDAKRAERKAARDAKKQARKDKRANKERTKNLQEEYENEHPEGTLFPDGKYYDAKGNEIKNKVKRKSYWEKMREKRSLQKTTAADERLRKRLEKAEQGEDAGDFSQIESEPSRETKKTEKYTSPEASTKEGEELLSRTKAGRNKALQDAAKKYNVKVEDLEAKEIGGKREFFPKQGAQGGSYILTEKELRDSGQVDEDGNVIEDKGTKWDDELGRFRIPTGGISDEALANLSDDEKKLYEAEMEERAKKEEAEMEALKPKMGNVNPDDVNSTMMNEGQIELDPVTNTYKYTDLYHKTRATIAEGNQQKVEPVVEEKKTLSNLEIRKKKKADKKYNDPNTSQYIKDQMLKEGYVPNESKSPMDMRDNRIYRNAVKGGTVQQNMIKSGYIPE